MAKVGDGGQQHGGLHDGRSDVVDRHELVVADVAVPGLLAERFQESERIGSSVGCDCCSVRRTVASAVRGPRAGLTPSLSARTAG